MKICFFGIYDKGYARNRVLMEGLKAHGVEIVEAHVDPQLVKGMAKYRALVRQARLARRQGVDLVLVAFPGHTVVWLAKLLFREKLVFDAFLSLYDSNVLDRKTHKPKSLAALIDWLLDWSGCALADAVLLDTNAHIEYFVHAFKVKKEKCIRVLIGADDAAFYPQEATMPSIFTVHFHGSFIPLQGVEHILKAAEYLKAEPVHFRIVGGGQEHNRMVALAREMKLANVEFVGKVPVSAVPGYIAASHVCLGIFGDTQKTNNVIPNKVYECIAMGKPVITADTPAIREVFADGRDMLLCPSANGEALAGAIKRLMSDASLRENIAVGGRRTFEAACTPERIAANLLTQLT